MKIKINKSIENLQVKTLKMMTNSVSFKSILRSAGVTFVIIFGSAWIKQPALFSLNSLMMIFGFFLIFMPYIFNNLRKTRI
ncbi:hypothetical protein NKR74_12345 [Bacillus sp. 3103sda1]|uniref:hypothetical protein n=1 Tax=Bacillus sp. 3103sda1 TaxID=2953808 RepID=UPI0020A13761|nr:hypothetical protein [Bacillus sp. 3103sda1]MCP1124097.1 hypothetical protein [Bacillus sp. 3103sda1]